MKILLGSHAFLPMLGGIEVISNVLAEEFVKAGHEVHLITQTPGDGADAFPFQVTRQPSAGKVRELAQWSDVFFQNNISIQTLLAALPVQRKIVIAYQTWIRRTDSKPSLLHWSKAQISRLIPRNVAISRAIADTIPGRSVLIPNPYDHHTYRPIEGITRDRDLIFVGRVVSDKGADLLLDALGKLAVKGQRPNLTIVGVGPEVEPLKAQAAVLGIAGQVHFAGPHRGEALARLMNQHRVLVVPSRWAEPFGIVALEGIGCGCAVIGSADGGLADAIGACGVTFPNGDVDALANAVERLLGDPSAIPPLLAAAPEHLHRHRGDVIAGRYLEVFSELVR
ncbi:MAG TPA: glycosyltransferase family 4 protein [Chthoniobacterales bacterium]